MSEQSEQTRDLGRVEGKLDLVIDILNKGGVKHEELEERVRKVESKLVYFTGFAFAAAFFLGKVDFTKLLAAASASGH